MLNLIVRIDEARRVVVLPGGGWRKEERVPGIGWVLADDEAWPRVDVPATLRSARAALARAIESADILAGS